MMHGQTKIKLVVYFVTIGPCEINHFFAISFHEFCFKFLRL